MADYDVGALALQSPPAEAALTTYRPAVLVANNGLYAAIAAGTIAAYKAGLQIYASALLSNPIAPGETGLAVATADWLPSVQGDYIWTAYVSTDSDQYEPNNNLSPTLVKVGPPPPPPEPKTLDDIYDKLGELGSEETLLAVAGQISPDPSTDTTQKQVLDTVATEETLSGIKVKTDDLATEVTLAAVDAKLIDNPATEETLAAIKADTDGLATETTLSDLSTIISDRIPEELGDLGGLKTEIIGTPIQALTSIPSLLECLGVLPFDTTAIPLVFALKTRTIMITALPSNTGLVYVGQEFLDASGANALAVLSPGDSIAIDYDDATDAIYVCGDIAAQNVIAGATIIPGA